MSCIFRFADEREKQLVKEKIIDDQINKGCDECPLLINRYLLKQRKINREQFKETHDSSFWNKCDVVDAHMTNNTKHYDHIYDMINKHGVCKGLEVVMENENN